TQCTRSTCAAASPGSAPSSGSSPASSPRCAPARPARRAARAPRSARGVARRPRRRPLRAPPHPGARPGGARRQPVPRRDAGVPGRPRPAGEPGARHAHQGPRPLPSPGKGHRDPPRPRPPARAHALLRAPAGPPALRPVHQVRRAAARLRGGGRARPDEVRAVIGYIVRRVLRAVTTLLGTTLIIFVLVRVVPADPAVSIAGPKADAETLAMIRKDLGLDDPLVVQYGPY